MLDEICETEGLKKPRTYRKLARKEYLKLAKSKKRSRKQIRIAIRKQLQYLRLDIRYITEFVQKGARLTSAQNELLNYSNNDL